MMEPQFKYQRVVQLISFNFPATVAISNIVDCGGMQLRTLFITSGWSPSNNIYFRISPDGKNFYNASNLDGSGFFLPLNAANIAIPLYPPLFDTAAYVQLFLQTAPSAASTIIGGLMPQYQGVHG